MKKNAVVLVLLISINSNLFAQGNAAKTFDMPAGNTTRVFYIDLDKGDKMKLELGSLDDLAVIGNLDSIVRTFMQDIEPLKDSLANELSSKKIDYIIDASGKNKIRIQQYAPIGSSYLVNQGALAAMKLEQDTIQILLRSSGGRDRMFKKSDPGFHYYRISFFVNNISNLVGYVDGRLQTNISKLRQNATAQWVQGKDGMMHAKAEPSISSQMPKGLLTAGGDYLTFRITADAQNYKNYFVPSVSASVIIVTNRRSIKREYSFTGESHFTFAKNDQGKLQTFRNSFLTLGYTQVNLGEKKSMLGLSPSFSFGWLARQRGNIYEKNTFRIGFGKAMIGSAIKVEPVIYFNNFFKGITPGIRVSL